MKRTRRQQVPATILTATMLGLCLAVLLAIPTATLAQQDQEASRRRQLEVFEQLLAETIQRHVSVHIDHTVQVERAAAEDGTDVAGMVVRASAAPRAHGMYITDYGVMFSIETPQVVVLPGELANRFEAPLFGGVYSFRTRSPERPNAWTGASQVVEFRTQMMRQSLEELESLLQKERAEGTDPATLEAMIADIERLKESLGALEVKAEAANPAHVDVESGGVEPEPAEIEVRVRGDDARVRTERGVGFYRDMVQQQRELAVVLERNRGELRNTVNGGAIEALAQYGSVIKDLDDEDRVSIVVLPPSSFGPVRVRHTVSDEYVISVRYGDIRDLDNRKIDLSQFRERVRVHNRLGSEVVWESEQE